LGENGNDPEVLLQNLGGTSVSELGRIAAVAPAFVPVTPATPARRPALLKLSTLSIYGESTG
jgi:hypothetical protein